ncbi:hypothetical protein HDE69_001946 [Pedobacter cryoconitis]|uniref:Uncharacterized protein n=1 Tax=Pedobacter cryoconitis TaxID=188932 RepID=A0A7W8YSP1_9SPHI|nr:BfmA/BtgA family mobilization protein [Pedobacter cryoconitis]MBB5620893.1 hypothetical protein [Pedobacter cryoconitis]
MEDINIKSIRYPVAVDEKLEKLRLKFGRTKRQFFMQMVDYFYKSKKDPADLNDEILKKEVANGISRIISFIQRQESDFLLPTLTDLGKLITVANAHTKYFEALGQYAVSDDKQTKQIFVRFTTLDNAIAKTQNHLESKTRLKDQFSNILEHYIIHRESLGWPVSNAKKEELQKHIRQSLENI